MGGGIYGRKEGQRAPDGICDEAEEAGLRDKKHKEEAEDGGLPLESNLKCILSALGIQERREGAVAGEGGIN